MEEKINKRNKSNERIAKSRELILHGNLWKTLLLISLPVALSNVVVALFNLFDVWFSGQIGKVQMAATNFVGPVNNLVSVIGTGLGIAATTLIARNIASRNYEKAKANLGQLLVITILFSLVLLLFGTVFCEQLLKLLGAEGEMLPKAIVYFTVILFALPLKFFNNVYIGYLRSVGSNKKIFNIILIQIILKFGINYLFIIVMDMGINGLGISTLLSSAIPTIFGIFELFVIKSNIKIDSFKYFIPNKKLMIGILVFSLPIIIEQTTRSFGSVLVTAMANNLGEQVLNAYGLTNRINSIVFSFSTGFGVAIVAIVSQNVAVGNVKRVKEAKYKGMILSLLVTCVLLFLILYNKTWIASKFTDDLGLITLTGRAMSIYTISVLPWAIMQIYFGVFRGIKRTYLTLIISLTRLWIFRVILLWILLRYTEYGSDAIWSVMLISNIAAMLASILIDIFLVNYKKYEKSNVSIK